MSTVEVAMNAVHFKIKTPELFVRTFLAVQVVSAINADGVRAVTGALRAVSAGEFYADLISWHKLLPVSC